MAQNTIASIFKSSQSFYAPAHVAIKEALAKPEATRGWKIMSTSAASRRKGKAKDVFSFELESERVWLLKHLGEITVRATFHQESGTDDYDRWHYCQLLKISRRRQLLKRRSGWKKRSPVAHSLNAVAVSERLPCPN